MSDQGGPAAARPDAALVAALGASHRRLLGALEPVDDVVVTRPSRLPGWTIGHVLTHLARNADSFVRMLEAAAVGEEVAQYPGGHAQRTGEIETGAARPAAAVTNDLRSACARLDAAIADAPDLVWAARFATVTGRAFPLAALPFRRLREVEIHHVDLGLGYSPSDWPPEFVEAALADSLADLPGRIAALGDRAELLAWVAGRRDDPPRVELAPF